MTDPVSQSPDAVPEIAIRQRAFLLDQINRAAGANLAKGPANRAIRAAVKAKLQLDAKAANRLREEMIAEGLLAMERSNRTDYFHLTDSGRDYLELHRQDVLSIPRGRSKGIIPSSNPDVRKHQKSYLLLQLLKADRYTLPQGEANRFDALGGRLELNAATAVAIRHELAEQGLLTITKPNRFEQYMLTTEGRLKLGTLPFYEGFEFKLRGRILNDLLEAAKDAAKEFTAAPVGEDRQQGAVSSGTTLEPIRLRETILGVFDELLRERHTVTGMVPIHEVRDEVRRQLGEAAARHEVFDSAVLACWQAGQIRLVPITDGTKASLEQLQASIPGAGETLFFLEAVHEPVAR